ncbi:AraC family transcriptional regulator [Chryseobacterium sp. CT-SW4]|uniref:AraC family transcriptional regulator n=1 Tax=Chryseobacterium sp. SW-1 TaxID=3157343 RepID=UPI003B02A69D
MSENHNILREIVTIFPDETFMVFDRVKNTFDFPIHYHPEIEINFILNGKGNKRVVGDHIGEIDSIELVMVGPNLPHCWDNYRCKTKRIREITVQFNQDFFEESLMKRRIMKPIDDLVKSSIRGVLFSKETAEKLKERFLNISKLKGFELFMEMMHILHELATAEDTTILSSYSVEQETFVDNDSMKVIHDYVHTNFERKITLEEVASVTNMSIVTFNRFIKKRSGKTFVNYLNEIRVGYAARWLVEKDLTVSEVAFEAGFNNMANFNKIFKSIQKCTPSEFKAQFTGIKKIQ